MGKGPTACGLDRFNKVMAKTKFWVDKEKFGVSVEKCLPGEVNRGKLEKFGVLLKNCRLP